MKTKHHSLFVQALTCVAIVLPLFAARAEEPAKASIPQPQVHGVNPAYLDRSVRPGDEFFEYANGAWLKSVEIPADRTSVALDTALVEQTSKRTADLIAEVAKKGAPAGDESRKIADLYNSFMDEPGIEAKGLSPLRPHLDAIAAIQNKQELARALGESLRADVDALNNTNFHTENLFGLWVAPSFNDSEHYTAYLMQGGVELPDREYYLSASAEMRDIRSKYQAHIATMLKLAGFSDTDARAARIVALEHAIAEKHRSLADNNDIQKANNPWKASDFAVKAPGLDWTEYFRGAGLTKQSSFIVWQPDAFAGESALVASTELETWKDWLAFHLIEAYAGGLPKALSDERFAFFGRVLSGTPQQRPRWKRGVGVVNGYLGDDVGRLFAERYFPPEAKAKAQAMVANIVAAFRKRIDALTWMSPATKAEAQAKLNTLYVGVGYGESWHDYSNFEVKADDIFGNLWRGDLADYHRQVARLGAPIDRKEWSMTPQTVNAVNLPLQNALNFPAAILQPPFFDPEAPAAANYGSIGSVIGHEISHTFDSEGSAFDSKGRVRNWWTAEDLAHFQAAIGKLATQYDAYKPFPDLALNGKQTLGENIADVAGLAAAYDGYKASLGGQPAPVKDGLSGDQQFFIAFAQAWAEKDRDAALRQQVLTDVHSPGHWRALTVRNIDSWYAAFDVQAGEKLYLAPEERVRIW
ncbi:MAG TPA: M13 family metallopeptidase [Candidatus Sulfotelmatobacter sp.]|nr:M13 family metallopeptidase [Candidatus Sulfotelmatobacter sp.]